jgi:hypothetical protein
MQFFCKIIQIVCRPEDLRPLSLDIIATQLKPKIYNSSQLGYGCLTFKIFYLYCGSQLNWMKNLKFGSGAQYAN